MKQYFRTLQSVLSSRWGDIRPIQAEVEQKTDRILRSTKLEDCIYQDLREADDTMQTANAECSRKLHSFPALSQDIFQSFYSLFPKRNAPETLTLEAQKFNAKILDRVTEDSDYAAMKSICEGRELPARRWVVPDPKQRFRLPMVRYGSQSFRPDMMNTTAAHGKKLYTTLPDCAV